MLPTQQNAVFMWMNGAFKGILFDFASHIGCYVRVLQEQICY
jgi:hypothetical protein